MLLGNPRHLQPHLTYKRYQVYNDFLNNLRMSNPSTWLTPKTSVMAEIKDVGLLHLVGLLVMAPLMMTWTMTTTTTTTTTPQMMLLMSMTTSTLMNSSKRFLNIFPNHPLRILAHEPKFANPRFTMARTKLSSVHSSFNVC